MSAETGAELRAEKYAGVLRVQRRLRLVAAITAAVLCIAFVFLIWLAPMLAGDDSMAPAIASGDTVFFNRFYKFTRSPDRGGIFAYMSEDGPRIARVIALPGERVEIAQGAVYINGIYLDESAYVTEAGTASLAQVTVGADEYFLMQDSRTEGLKGALVGADKLTGRALIRTAPIGRIAFFG